MLSNEFDQWPTMIIENCYNKYCMNLCHGIDMCNHIFAFPCLFVCELALSQLSSRFTEREEKGENGRETDVEGFKNKV